MIYSLNVLNLLTWQYAQRLLTILIPLIAMVALVLWWLYRSDVDALQSGFRADELDMVQLAVQTVATELSMLRGDAQYLSEQTTLHRWLETGDPSTLEHLGADFFAFAGNRGLYDQVRFLNEHGREVVRINWHNGQPRKVPPEELQDKSGSDYVEKTLLLNQGDVYVSRLDLNIERNKIEQPVKPVIRLGVPVVDSSGRKRGIVVLNYLGQRMLTRLHNVRSQHRNSLWLLNAEGYWLLGPRAEVEWNFMYPDREAMRFDREHAEIWKSILAGPETGQLMNEQGLFTYARIEPESSPIGPYSERWILVAHMPESTLATNLGEHTQSLYVAFIVLAGLLTIVSAAITHKELQRRQSEDRIRESEIRFRSLLDSAPDAVVIVDQSGRINLVNSQAEKWFGYARDELLGQRIEKLVPERFCKQHVIDREGYSAMPLVRPMGAGANLSGLRKDGTEFPVEISLSPLQTEQGLLITSIIRDVSKSQIQARYQDLVNNLPVGVYRNTPGPEGRYIEVNPTMLKIFEAESTEELLAHSVADLYCDPSLRSAISDKILHQGFVQSEEMLLRTLKGRKFHGAITAVVKKDPNGNIYFDGILKDVSGQKENEHHIQDLNESLRARSAELEAINRELEAFSYSVSHDLRAPLRAIDGFSHTLLHDYTELLDDKGRDRLGRVRAAAQRMAGLIDDLLNLSRVSRAEINRKPIDITKIANEVIQTLRHSDPLRTVEFTVQSSLLTKGDVRLVRVVMDNLLGNAWKFTGQRADAKIEIGGNPDGTEFIYFVRDNGAGFNMDYAEKLFGAFQRLHDTDEFPGTGIGLATVQRVIHKHGGRIWAESAVGQGTTFYFTLQPSGIV